MYDRDNCRRKNMNLKFLVAMTTNQKFAGRGDFSQNTFNRFVRKVT